MKGAQNKDYCQNDKVLKGGGGMRQREREKWWNDSVLSERGTIHLQEHFGANPKKRCLLSLEQEVRIHEQEDECAFVSGC